ncbi:MAG: hypothetical protein M1828_001438 [Chrysothrix sp. TS-e1954]|nr:MAG: hypothetical protein M1828_001438 [Chrysothrix sp. TS-e1954]
MRVYRTALNLAALQYSSDSPDVNTQVPLKGPFEDDAVFVSIDIENLCWCGKGEQRKLTEVGISWLDTRELEGVIAKDRGVGLREHIHDRHLVVEEHLRKGHGLSGRCTAGWHQGNLMDPLFCASERIGLAQVGDVVVNHLRRLVGLDGVTITAEDIIEGQRAAPSMFRDDDDYDDEPSWWIDQQAKYPSPPKSPRPDASSRGRKVYFIFHDPKEDVKALRAHGVNLDRYFSGHELINTQSSILGSRLVSRGLRNTSQPRLEEFLEYAGVTATSLHNGSNDARFTLEAFIAVMMMTNDQYDGFGRYKDMLPASWTPKPVQTRLERSDQTTFDQRLLSRGADDRQGSSKHRQDPHERQRTIGLDAYLKVVPKVSQKERKKLSREQGRLGSSL